MNWEEANENDVEAHRVFWNYFPKPGFEPRALGSWNHHSTKWDARKKGVTRKSSNTGKPGFFVESSEKDLESAAKVQYFPMLCDSTFQLVVSKLNQLSWARAKLANFLLRHMKSSVLHFFRKYSSR